MAGSRALHQLSAARVSKMTDVGRYGDGGGLYLQVTKSGSRSWIFRFMLAGKSREMGLGAYPTVSLSDARTRAAAARVVLERGEDPIADRDRQRAIKAITVEQSEVVTFAMAAKEYIEIQRPGWANPKHVDQWTNTIETYTAEVFGSTPVESVTTDQVLKALKPIWATKTETATRVRGRIENIIDWAIARGLRTANNPARWKGHLEKILPSPSRVRKVEHHEALGFDKMYEFMTALRDRPSTSATALEFTILTAARTGEVIEARRDEFDLDGATWVIPAERMKAKKEHRVALSPRACEIAQMMIANIPDDDRMGYLFTGQRKKLAAGRHSLSNMAMLELVKGMRGEFEGITVHGFRSAFRDWAAETTEYAGEVVEAALAHTVKNKVEAAYRRGDLLDRRRPLMQEWEKYCFTNPKKADQQARSDPATAQ
ncbi:tyrosine-type recombinase/integrase [Robbsia andropogonis]|uniref:tyrosine-type recombinase/integrase n=1 Tax=Robbsia andropogonis TaxID=28092 RepID=UPI002A6A5DAF|nr:integrase arm-type DNA-binding domain-containing protein [Robbsia andropogonis]